MKTLVALLMTIAITGCVTGSQSPSFEKSKVIETMNENDRPDWTKKDETVFEEGGDVSIVAILTMNASARPEACLKASTLDGQGQLVQHVKAGVTSSAQLLESSVSEDPGYEALTAMLSQGSIQGSRVTGKHWERVQQSDESGARILKLHCYSKVSVKKAELARMMREATNKQSGNAQIRQKLLDAQSKYLENLSEEPAH